MASINYRDPRPIYEQVKDNIRKQIMSGIMKPDEQLPSVREMAMREQVNPNTVQRAYRELEAEGYIYSVPGKGSFAGEKKEVDVGRQHILLTKFDETVLELLFLGAAKTELCARINEKEVLEGI